MKRALPGRLSYWKQGCGCPDCHGGGDKGKVKRREESLWRKEASQELAEINKEKET